MGKFAFTGEDFPTRAHRLMRDEQCSSLARVGKVRGAIRLPGTISAFRSVGTDARR